MSDTKDILARRQELLELAQPYQPTDAEKKDREELDRELALFRRHADDLAKAEQSCARLLHAAKMTKKRKELEAKRIEDLEAKHAAELQAALEQQKKELDIKYEAASREAHSKSAEQLAAQKTDG